MINEELDQHSSEIKNYLKLSNSIGIALLDDDFRILECNLGFTRIFNPRKNPAGVLLTDFLELDKQNLPCGEELKLSCSRESGMNGVMHCYVIRTESRYLLLCEKIVLTESRALEQIGVMNDDLINLQRELVKKNRLLENLKQELNGRVDELEEAIGRIKRLEGIISICMYCKKIRNKQESWEILEKYITEHSDALFSHSICPTCMSEHYPDSDD